MESNDVFINSCIFKDTLLSIFEIAPNAILSGGAVRDIVISNKPKDYDFYFYSQDDFNASLENLLCKGFRVTDSNYYTMTGELFFKWRVYRNSINF